MRIPIVVKTLLILNIAVYLFDLILGASGIDLKAMCALYYFRVPYAHPYQLITYMFMHGGFSHLFFNMFALWMFGRIMEQVWGPQKFLLYYLVCGVGAGLIQEAGQLLGIINSYASTIGASGAVFGVLLAFGLTFPDERLFIIPIPFPIKAKYFVGLYALLELFQGSSNDGVAHYAHIGGMLFGLLLILYWRRSSRRSHLGGTNFWNASADNKDGWGGNSYDRGSYSNGFFSRMRSWTHAQQTKKRENMYASSSSAKHESDYAYNARKKEENDEIDRILDKIRQGGYESLTAEEKRKLFDASKH